MVKNGDNLTFFYRVTLADMKKLKAPGNLGIHNNSLYGFYSAVFFKTFAQ
jgi:hypothetical protein